MSGRARGVAAVLCLGATLVAAGGARAFNPVFPGWYADPEIRIFGHRYWIYPTTSDVDAATRPPPLTPLQRAIRAQHQVRPSYLLQTYIDAFSSPDLVHWTRHSHVLDVTRVSWAASALWAPSTIEVGGRFYLFFGANDPQSDRQLGGIGVAMSDRPSGLFSDLRSSD